MDEHSGAMDGSMGHENQGSSVEGTGSFLHTLRYQQVLQEHDERSRISGCLWTTSVSVHDVKQVPREKTAIVRINCLNERLH